MNRVGILKWLCLAAVVTRMSSAAAVAADVPTATASQANESPTFNKHIAPTVFSRCAPCHRPGQSAPFSLLTYADVRKRGREIVEVIGRRQMPPWLPEPGYGEFRDERRLTDQQIALISRWVSEGMAEGSPADLPPLPKWSSDWQLGEPDMVLRMPEPYNLAADGRDVYWNFVIPVPVKTPRYVKAVEFRPDNRAVVHHAFVKVDSTAQSRRRDAEELGPGFGGMDSNAQMPGGHFLTWQPGKITSEIPAGLAWRLNTNADLVLQTHLKPTGKPEALQAAVGLYFTDQAPTNSCFKLMLVSLTVDIPPGRPDYVVEDNYVLPVGVEVLAVLPHAHYLAKEMQGYAVLPDGTKKWLLLIKEWDFRWQGDYRYAKPVFLPKGTALHMRFTYDNSPGNVNNPNSPPKRVTYGSDSSDEMAELWFQVLPVDPNSHAILTSDYNKKMQNVFRDKAEHLLRTDPGNAKAHAELGLILLGDGKRAEAAKHFDKAIQLKPDYDEPHYLLGVLLRMQQKHANARLEFEQALKLNPKHYKAHGNLGLMSMEQGDRARAEFHLREALRLNPDDALAREKLAELLRQ